jgi:hypothetical protein
MGAVADRAGCLRESHGRIRACAGTITAKKAVTSKAKTPTAAPSCWYELVTTNPKAATTFYKSVFGWTAKDAGQTGMDYTLLSAKEHMIAGLIAR